MVSHSGTNTDELARESDETGYHSSRRETRWWWRRGGSNKSRLGAMEQRWGGGIGPGEARWRWTRPAYQRTRPPHSGTDYKLEQELELKRHPIDSSDKVHANDTVDDRADGIRRRPDRGGGGDRRIVRGGPIALDSRRLGCTILRPSGSRSAKPWQHRRDPERRPKSGRGACGGRGGCGTWHAGEPDQTKASYASWRASGGQSEGSVRER